VAKGFEQIRGIERFGQEVTEFAGLNEVGGVSRANTADSDRLYTFTATQLSELKASASALVNKLVQGTLPQPLAARVT
jgi:hypothetical protein